MSDQAALPPSPEYRGEWVAERTDRGNLLVRRWAGAWIDFIALAVLIFAPAFIFGLVMGFSKSGSGGAETFAGVLVIFGVLLALAYFPVTEGVWGRSLGKLVT